MRNTYEFGDHGDNERVPARGIARRFTTLPKSRTTASTCSRTTEYLGRWGRGSGNPEESMGTAMRVDQNNHRVQKFTPEATTWPVGNSAPEATEHAVGHLDRQRLERWVADWRNDRVRSSTRTAPSWRHTENWAKATASSTVRPACAWTAKATFTSPTGATSGEELDPDRSPLERAGPGNALPVGRGVPGRQPRGRRAVQPVATEHLRTPLLIYREAYFWGPSAVKLEPACT